MRKKVQIKIPDNDLETARNGYFQTSWTGVSVEHLRLRGKQELAFSVASPANFLTLHDIVRVEGETTFGSHTSHKRDLRNQLSFMPAKFECSGWARYDGENSTTAIHLDTSDECKSFGQFALEKLRPKQYFESDWIAAIVRKLAAVARGEMAAPKLYGESLATVLSAELHLNLSGSFNEQQRSALDQARLARVFELIEANLGEEISLAGLASEVGLSRFHFLRAFKRAVGQTPHQYVMSRRVERAKHLLETSSLSIGAIAQAVGFASPGHFARVFQRFTGVGARSFRRDRRS